ncbi:MAG: YebC/PmpR family DNA-binding transcriptional regulator, partial [Bacilli bacterium]|nr:YebC/PmpR family DNA-binding transcriptional regulator [Bacilli bacterium]
MSGHSKWATIHRKKGLLDAARGKMFQKLTKEIMVAAKGGSPDPNQNAALRLAVDKAKAQNMPKDNIQKAIDKAVGSADAANYENLRYEGYGHGGVAFMVDCLTDNRNRTASAVRSAFTKAGGNLGTDGSVSYMFERKGSIVIPGEYDEDTMMMVALDAGALDFEKIEDSYVITTDQNSFTQVRDALEENGVKEFLECELTYVPTMEVELDEEGQEKVMKLVDTLEDLDDVQ